MSRRRTRMRWPKLNLSKKFFLYFSLCSNHHFDFPFFCFFVFIYIRLHWLLVVLLLARLYVGRKFCGLIWELFSDYLSYLLSLVSLWKFGFVFGGKNCHWLWHKKNRKLSSFPFFPFGFNWQISLLLLWFKSFCCFGNDKSGFTSKITFLASSAKVLQFFLGNLSLPMLALWKVSDIQKKKVNTPMEVTIEKQMELKIMQKETFFAGE